MSEGRISAKILELLALRNEGATICPSEVLPLPLRKNQSAMEMVRNVARRLFVEGRIVITQKGRVIDPLKTKGPIRLRLKNKLNLNISNSRDEKREEKVMAKKSVRKATKKVVKKSAKKSVRKATKKSVKKSSKKPGLYANIRKAQKRAKHGGKPVRKKGQAGAPTEKAFKKSAKTAEK